MRKNNRIREPECKQAAGSGQEICVNTTDRPDGASANAVDSHDGSSANASGGAVRDINSKRIFEDPVLCAQFLRNYVGVEEVKHVSPDDIENVSTRYHPYLGAEFQSDTVNRIRLYDETGKEKEEPLYLVSLIEHKSDVDYDVVMQILKYMTCIWQDYAKEQDRSQNQWRSVVWDIYSRIWKRWIYRQSGGIPR
ncbi:MAG: Rpn family recombination-promoting nuclease/putative transposase [Clostridiales bacterium]|nr:Rpn family recombination-promoting nuclease/putative transposase [Clostridiales bacterium]